MNAELVGNPDFGFIKFVLNQGERLLVESGAMAAMDTDIGVQAQMMGGIVPSVMRRLLAGESLLMGEYSSKRDGSRLQISPGIPGEVMQIPMTGSKSYFLQAGSFLACTPGIQLNTVFGGLKAIFSGEGMFFLKVHGEGQLWVNAYGSVVEHDLQGGEFIVDTGHIVGWEETVNWEISGMGNLFSTIFSGEGLVLRLRGNGKVWLQTRSLGGLAGWLSGYCRG
ncbi:MAG: TIGR00266 family protein [Armatimonadetes bacterium]|nr:TIGR00266 family protein [Armatimonadota bacterium]